MNTCAMVFSNSAVLATHGGDRRLIWFATITAILGRAIAMVVMWGQVVTCKNALGRRLENPRASVFSQD